jgi:hypothetical protein
MMFDKTIAGLIPDGVINDESGYAVNVPAIVQGYPYWWELEPKAWFRILDVRRELGITVDDQIAQLPPNPDQAGATAALAQWVQEDGADAVQAAIDRARSHGGS